MLFARDTSPEARERLIQSYRAMTPARRVAVALDATEAMRAMIRADIAARHPEADDEQRRILFLRRWVGDALTDEWLRWRDSDAGASG